MKIHIRFSVILLLVTAALFAVGCGASNDRFTAERSEEVTSEGMMLCYQCHNDTDNPDGLEKVFGNSPSVIGWLNSPHANNETFSFVTYLRYDLSPDNIGMPYFGYEGLGQSADCSTKCHDQLGEGRRIDDFASETGDTSLGRVDRPVVGCDSCHGSGNGHMAEAAPGADVCGQCHSSEFFHNHYHPEADNIVEDYQSSPHAKSPNIYGMNICSRCHTNEGAQGYIEMVNGTEAPADISYALGSQSNIKDPSAVQCATCHEAHTLELLGGRSDAGDGSWSAQFKTCTSCHQLYDKNGAPNSAYHNGWAPDVLITDTHFDDPSDSNIQGYIINATISHSSSAGNSNGGTCLDCHNEHNADNTINRQWAHSGHGGFILDTVDSVTGIGNVTTSEAPGWTERDFKAANRQSCQRCHTATGFRNLANDPSVYDPANNVFTATGEQREMLYCWACHTDNVGDFRNPGIFNTISPYSQPADRIAAVGDLKGSNICMACHSGRHSGDEIKNPPVPIDFTNSRASSSHHLVAGGIMFNTLGYEYNGLDYLNVPWFGHRYIGLDNEPGGENGPCVGCHMSAQAVGHTLEVVKKDESGVITEITAIEVCNNCHSLTPWTASTLEEKAEGFEEAHIALDDLMTSKRSACSSSRDWTCPYPDAGSDEPEKTMGAYFNNRLLGEDPGAFAHNSLYTKRLFFDSYDWMDNGIINGTIDLSLYPDAAEWLQGDGSVDNDDTVTRGTYGFN